MHTYPPCCIKVPLQSLILMRCKPLISSSCSQTLGSRALCELKVPVHMFTTEKLSSINGGTCVQKGRVLITCCHGSLEIFNEHPGQCSC